MLKNRVQYVDIGAGAYDQKQREREIAYLQKKAAKLGFELSPHNPIVTRVSQDALLARFLLGRTLFLGLYKMLNAQVHASTFQNLSRNPSLLSLQLEVRVTA